MPDYFSQQVNKLTTIARQEFGRLSDAEMRVLRATATGDCTTCNMALGVLGDNPAEAEAWGEERRVRAELIRWLCTVPEATKAVAPRGIQVRGAKITGLVDLASVTIPFPITCIQCRLRDIDLRYASINLLNLTGSLIESLIADGAEVRTMLILNQGFSAKQLRLQGVKIGGSIDCRQARLTSQDVALYADRLDVKGDVVFSDLSSEGTIEFLGAQIGGMFSCDGGGFAAVNLQRATIKNGLFWRRIQRCTSLDLSGAYTSVLSDDETSWSQTKEFILDGFVYEAIIGTNSQRDAETRLGWLSRQKKFTPQPYRQLAKVFREMGYDNSSKAALFELESRLRAAERERLIQHHPIRRFMDSTGDALSWATIGYGVHPGFAILESIVLAGLGWVVFRRAYQLGAIVPTDEKARAAFQDGRTPSNYPPFTPLIYSIENCIPLVKLGQDERWQPNPDFRPAPPKTVGKSKSLVRRVVNLLVHATDRGLTITPAKLRWFRWIIIALGWLLATFLVGGLSGLIKTS